MPPTAQIANPLTTWLQAARGVTTLHDYRQVQPLAVALAKHLERATGYTDQPISPLLRSDNPKDVLGGLAVLDRAIAGDEGYGQRVQAEIPKALAAGMATQAETLRRVVRGGRGEFHSITEAAARSSTILGYLWRRLVREPDATRAVSREHYRYDPSRVEGHLFLHRSGNPIPPTAEEGQAAYHSTHGGELDQLRGFLDDQLSLHSANAVAAYTHARGQIIATLDVSRGDWNGMVREMRGLGAPPSFATVSEAFWRRDEAIRNHPGLRERGIGPWEYDLIRARGGYDHERATPQERIRFFGGEWAYLLRVMTERYDQLEEEKGDRRAADTRRLIREDRFALEPIFMKLAKGEDLSVDEAGLLGYARPTYLGPVHQSLEEVDLDQVEKLQAAAEEAYNNYATALHRRHVAMAGHALERFHQNMRRVSQVDRQEQTWQVRRYTDLMVRAMKRGLARDDERRFQTALGHYRDAATDYNAYAERMLRGDPTAREHTRNSKYRVLFVQLWELHRTVKDILRGVKDPEADKLQILTFAFKTQAQFLRREARGMEGFEPLAEVTGHLKPVLEAQEAGIYSLPFLYEMGGRDWGVNLVARYARDVHIVGAGELFGYFGQAIRSETTLLEGGLTAYPPNADQVEAGRFAHRGGVVNATHLGQFEFPVTIGIPYATGLPHTTVLAQEGVRAFPIAGPFLGGIERGGTIHRWLRRIPLIGKQLARLFPGPTVHLGSGAYVQRIKDPARRALENFVLETNVAMGNWMNIYGNGTRDIAMPLPSPFADLRDPAALHMPDYHPTRYSTGAQTIGVAQATGTPVIPVAYDLGRLYAEPSMPMPSGWGWRAFFQDPRKAIKPYAGFWEPSTMFPYLRPGEDSFTVAYGEPIPPESFVTEADLHHMGYADQLAQWERELGREGRDKQAKWLLLQLNFALVREAEMRAGYTATAKLHG